MRPDTKKKAFGALLLIVFIDSMGYGLIIPVLLRLLTQVGSQAYFHDLSHQTRNFLYGFGIALGPFAYLLAAPVVGSLSDAGGRRKVLFWCLIFSLLGFLLPVFGIIFMSLSLIFVGRVIAGGASSSQPVAWAAVTDLAFGKKKAWYLALIAFVMTLAMFTGPLIGAYLSNEKISSYFGLKIPFLLAAVLVYINILLLWKYFRETHVSQSARRWQQTWLSSFAIFKLKSIRLLIVSFFVYEFAWSLYFQDISLFFVGHFHYSVDHSALFLTYLGVWMALSLLLLYPLLLKFLNLFKLLIFGFVIAGLGLCVCALSQTADMQWIFVVPLSIGVGLIYPTILALMSDRVGETEQGWLMGIIASMLALSWMLSSLLTGVLTNINAHLPLLAALVAMVLALAISVLNGLNELRL